MEEKKKVILTGALFILIVVAVVLIYYLVTHKKSSDVPETLEIIEEEPVKLPEKEKSESELIEPLNVTMEESDKVLRDFLGDISSDPRLSEWMRMDHIIKSFVAAVDNIANGLSPRKQVNFFEPKGEFLAEKKGEHYIIDEDSYKRYDPVANVFDSINTNESVILYHRFKPLIQKAYEELGYPDKDFDNTLKRAIKELLAVPVLEEEIVLISKLKSFELYDSELEGLSQAQKHLFRMGPENIRKIQQKLRELYEELND